MIYSMTGFGQASTRFKALKAEVEIQVEIKTVNSKFLDIQVRSPRVFQAFDRKIQQLIRDRLLRGRVEINIARRVLEGVVEEVRINHAQAKKLIEAFRKVEKENKIQTPLSLSDLLQNPDWFELREVEVDANKEWPTLQKLLMQVLDQVEKSRRQEGQTLEKVVRTHLKEIQRIFVGVAAKNDDLLRQLKEKWRERVKELTDQKMDDARLEQEVTLWTARSDFREEIDRGQHHLKSFEEILSLKDSEHGRRLEFVVQELHRELNTMGSKCADAKLTREIIEMKATVERIREQIQNIE